MGEKCPDASSISYSNSLAAGRETHLNISYLFFGEGGNDGR